MVMNSKSTSVSSITSKKTDIEYQIVKLSEMVINQKLSLKYMIKLL